MPTGMDVTDQSKKTAAYILELVENVIKDTQSEDEAIKAHAEEHIKELIKFGIGKYLDLFTICERQVTAMESIAESLKVIAESKK